MLVASADGAGVQVQSITKNDNGIQEVLSIASPCLVAKQAKDGNTYTQVLIDDCGNDNDFGRPALPVISHTVEIPMHAEATAALSGEVLSEARVDKWVYPHQPPVPKVLGPQGDPLVVIDSAYYTAAKAAGFRKAFDGQKTLVTTPYTKRGHRYLNVLMRPVAYDVSSGLLQYPTQVTLNITWTVNPLPKAAGPRTGNVTVVEVTLTDQAQLDELVKEGFDIAERKGDVLTIYATDAELAALRGKGLSVLEVGRDPGTQAYGSAEKALGAYHTYVTLTNDLEAYATAHSDICRLVSIGQSVQGRDLWAMKITDNPDVNEDEPELKYVGSIHGDEPLGAEMCLYFIDYLLTNYGALQRVTDLVDGNEIWVLPLMNPDGHEANSRYNHDGIDLNRSFPDGAEEAIGNVLYGPEMDTEGRPLETVAVMEWTAARHFVLSANFHGGSLVVNYPYDNDGYASGVDSPTPDDALFESISTAYSSHNTPMWNSTLFTHGITNGAVWYVIDGGMQDWNYRYLGCNEVTVEMSNNKAPAASELPQFWEDNRESMLAYLETVKTGVRGIVTDAQTGRPITASVEVVGKNHIVYTDPEVGDYHRQLLPGTYSLVFRAPGYAVRTMEDVIVTDGATTRQDVELQTGPTPGVIVVSVSSMAMAAAAFRTEKQIEGFDVHDVTVSGSPTAETIRGLIRTTYNAYQPEYVIILGDVEIIPTFTDVDDYASDLPYALMDTDEGFTNYLGKDLIVGRVSLKTASAIKDYTNKLAAYAGGVKHSDLTWLSGGATLSENNYVEATHNWVMNNALPTTCHNQLFYQADGSTAATFSAYVNAGTDGVIYSGHGSVSGWLRYSYNSTNLAALTNRLDVPMVFGHCCDTGIFDESVCFAESWLQTTGRGIVYVGASGNTYWDEDDILEKMEFKAMKTTPGLAIGDAVAYGLERVYSSYPGSARYYYTVYQTFGDPTLRMFWPGGFAFTTSVSLPYAYVGEPLSLTIRTINGVGRFTWTLVGTLPDGLTFDTATHTITGTPTSTGTEYVTIQVTDSADTDITRTFYLTVLDRLAMALPDVLPDAMLNKSYTFALHATGGTSPVTYSVGTLPPGLSMNTNGVISGTPTESGNYSIVITATDSGIYQQTVQKTFLLSVRDTAAAFEWLETPADAWKEIGDFLLLRVRCQGTVGNITYQWFKNGSAVSGETNAQMSIASLAESDQGWYTCVVTDESKHDYVFAPVLLQVFPLGILPATHLAGLAIVVLTCLGWGVRSTLRARRTR